MSDEAAKTRRLTWYGNFKRLAEDIQDKGPADILRIFHRFLDGNDKYGSMTIAASAKRSLAQVIKDLQLDGNRGISALGNQLPEKICQDSTIAVERR